LLERVKQRHSLPEILPQEPTEGLVSSPGRLTKPVAGARVLFLVADIDSLSCSVEVEICQ
jgi:hypothetical protein